MHGDKAVAHLVAATRLRFAEPALDAVVFEGISQSHPLRLRASYDEETKLATLIHELAHRLVHHHAPLNVASARSDQQRRSHELIDLFLFDVWVALCGEEFARRQVEIESQRRATYRDAWQATLALDRTRRAARLQSLLER